MIARFWTAKIAKAHAHVYSDHLKSQVLTTLRKIDGYIDAKLLERETNDSVEIMVITFWRSLGCIKKFAGPDIENAVVSDDIVSIFLQYDKRVRHYEIVVTDDQQHR